MSAINLFIYIYFFSLINSLIIGVGSDFDLDIEYRLEKQETEWFKRGKILFRKKAQNSDGSSITLYGFNFTPQMKTEVQKECMLKGNYILQFTNNQDISERYYTSINPCDLVSNKFHDKIIINTLIPIIPGKIKSLYYTIEQNNNEEFEDGDDEEIVQKKKGKKKYSKIELAQIEELKGPLFLDEITAEELKEKEIKEKKMKKLTKKKESPLSILKKHWYLVVLLILISMFQINPDYQKGAQGK